MTGTYGSQSCCLVALVCFAALATAVNGGVDVGTLPNQQHGIGGTFEILSTTRIRLRGFRYDGGGPAAFLYYFEPGVPVDRFAATSQGRFIRLPSPAGDSTGALARGRRYFGEDLEFDLPSGDVCDISTFTIWCEDFDVFFSTLLIPRDTFVSDGADPCTVVGLSVATPPPPTQPPPTQPPPTQPLQTTTPPLPAPGGHENCIPFSESLQLSWTVDRVNSRISFLICGCESSNPNVAQYMAFGLSGNQAFTFMEGSDVTVAWVDSSLGPMAQDYHLRAGNRVQCRAGLGVCPDTLDNRGTCSNDVFAVSGFTVNREQCVSFTRLFTTADTDCDIPFDPDNTQQYIVWGVGGLEETAFRHFTRSSSTTAPLHLGRSSLNQCSGVAITCDQCPPFTSEEVGPTDGSVFRATIGPSGNDRGYMALTGQAGWGIAWYINGVLAPELVVQRGRTYTFLIEGGRDPSVLANYHPFYITDSISGGRLRNNQEQREEERVYAGFDQNDTETGIGRLCLLFESGDSLTILNRCGSFSAYMDSLSSSCRPGEPGRLLWTPDENTPDVVYYQCATHRNLGWRIRVMDPETVEPETVDPMTMDPVTVAPETMDPVTVSTRDSTESTASIAVAVEGSSPPSAVISLTTLALFTAVGLFLAN